MHDVNSPHWYKLSPVRREFISASPIALAKGSVHVIPVYRTVIYTTTTLALNCVSILEAPWKYKYFLFILIPSSAHIMYLLK